MLNSNMGRSQCNIPPYHLQCGVSQYLLQGKHVPTVDQKSLKRMIGRDTHYRYDSILGVLLKVTNRIN